MELNDIASISVESCASVLLLVCCYKILRAKIDTESSCISKIFNFKVSTHNAGVENPTSMTQV